VVVEQGHFYKDQIANKLRVIAWSHRSRFATALQLIGQTRGNLLDYGCGDGTFLAMAADVVARGHGVDVNVNQVADCRSRLADLRNLTFSVPEDLCDGKFDGAFDLITCMETLEHVPEPVVDAVLADITRLCAPGGRVIISVPVEIGPSFLLKQTIRALAAQRGVSSYHLAERYGARDALRMLFAGRHTVVPRRAFTVDGRVFYSHFGFNWRRMRDWVSRYLRVERTLFTPVGSFGGLVSSQAYFVCRRSETGR
jgi:2-polyprenyl-3-methyl-5-hydroxy-6-metoxy-1,4-benzoquinol methylase